MELNYVRYRKRTGNVSFVCGFTIKETRNYIVLDVGGKNSNIKIGKDSIVFRLRHDFKDELEEQYINTVIALYPKRTYQEIADYVGVTKGQVKYTITKLLAQGKLKSKKKVEKKIEKKVEKVTPLNETYFDYPYKELFNLPNFIKDFPTMTTEQLADKYGLNIKQATKVVKWCRDHKCIVGSKEVFNGISRNPFEAYNISKKDFISLFKAKYNKQQIATMLNCSTDVVTELINYCNVTDGELCRKAAKKQEKFVWTSNTDALVIMLHRDGITSDYEIAKKLGCGHATVGKYKRILRQKGLLIGKE